MQTSIIVNQSLGVTPDMFKLQAVDRARIETDAAVAAGGNIAGPARRG